MRFYCYSASRIEELVGKTRRSRRIVLFVGLGLLLTALLLMFYRFQISASLERKWNAGFIFSFVLASQAIQGGWNPRKKAEKLRTNLSLLNVTLTEEEIQIRYSKELTRNLAREDILRVEEPSVGCGLYLRSPNRYRWMVIPSSLDDYEEIKSELARMGIPTGNKRIATNYEEFIFVLLFCGTLICAGLVNNLYVLGVCLIVATLLVPCGMYVISASSENSARRWKSILGTLIPVFAVAIKIWIVLRS